MDTVLPVIEQEFFPIDIGYRLFVNILIYTNLDCAGRIWQVGLLKQKNQAKVNEVYQNWFIFLVLMRIIATTYYPELSQCRSWFINCVCKMNGQPECTFEAYMFIV